MKEVARGIPQHRNFGEMPTYDNTKVKAALLLGAKLQFSNLTNDKWLDTTPHDQKNIDTYNWVLFRAVIDD